MDMYRRKFTFETTPIRVTDRPQGGTNTRMNTLDGRIVDAYSGMAIGMVTHTPTGDGVANFIATTFFPIERGGSDEVPEPKGGWGRRFDLAADAVWNFHNRQLPIRARLVKFLWRWVSVFWFLAGAVLSAAISAWVGEAITTC